MSAICGMRPFGFYHFCNLRSAGSTELHSNHVAVAVAADAAQYAANAVKEAQMKEAMYGVGNLQSTPCMKSFYNKALLSSTEPYASTESKQSSGGPQVPQMSPSILQVTGGAFRPVQQSAYIIRPQGSGGGTSSTDSCVKPDASSTSSNNETNINNDNSGGWLGFSTSCMETCV